MCVGGIEAFVLTTQEISCAAVHKTLSGFYHPFKFNDRLTKTHIQFVQVDLRHLESLKIKNQVF